MCEQTRSRRVKNEDPSVKLWRRSGGLRQYEMLRGSMCLLQGTCTVREVHGLTRCERGGIRLYELMFHKVQRGGEGRALDHGRGRRMWMCYRVCCFLALH